MRLTDSILEQCDTFEKSGVVSLQFFNVVLTAKPFLDLVSRISKELLGVWKVFL